MYRNKWIPKWFHIHFIPEGILFPTCPAKLKKPSSSHGITTGWNLFCRWLFNSLSFIAKFMPVKEVSFNFGEDHMKVWRYWTKHWQVEVVFCLVYKNYLNLSVVFKTSKHLKLEYCIATILLWKSSVVYINRDCINCGANKNITMHHFLIFWIGIMFLERFWTHVLLRWKMLSVALWISEKVPKTFCKLILNQNSNILRWVNRQLRRKRQLSWKNLAISVS